MHSWYLCVTEILWELHRADRLYQIQFDLNLMLNAALNEHVSLRIFEALHNRAEAAWIIQENLVDFQGEATLGHVVVCGVSLGAEVRLGYLEDLEG